MFRLGRTNTLPRVFVVLNTKTRPAMGRDKTTMEVLIRYGVSLGGATLLLAGSLDAFGVG